jgi:branched-chain amino acid transport system permease protein
VGTTILTLLRSAALLTSCYFLISFGLTLQYGVGGFPNLALGYIGLVGVLVCVDLWKTIGAPLAILVGLVVSAVFGIAVQKFIINPLNQGRNDTEKRLNVLYGTFALLVALPTILHKIFGYQALNVALPTGRSFFGTISVLDISVIGLAVVLFVVSRLLLNRTVAGHIVQAVTENQRLASIMGINIKRVYLIVAGISGILSFIGFLVWGRLFSVEVKTGGELVIYGFIIAVLGGLGNISGAIIASAVIGISYAVSSFAIGGVYVPVVTFVVGTICIILFPRGFVKSSRTI